MAVNKSKEIEIIWKLNPSTFEKINADVYANPPQRLGSKHSSVDRMVNVYGAEMMSLMPSIIGTSPHDVEWYKKLRYYWDSVSYQIPSSGKRLEIGFSYDINDVQRKDAIADLCASIKDIKDDSTLADYCESDKIKEEKKYLYAKPINVSDYLMYRYCLVDGEVANSLELANKSTRIRFIISNPKAMQDFKRKNHATENKANALYIESLKDSTIVANMLYSLEIDITDMDQIDREIKLKDLSIGDPTKFIEIASDKTLAIKAKIERYILKGVLNRLPDSSIIVDSSDVTFTVGGDLNEAINFFTSEDAIKVAKVKEFASKAKK